MQIVIAILAFCVIIIIHELGHFTAAKLCGIQVNEFAVGMGPVILRKKGRETNYVIRLLPIGGSVSMEGEQDSSDNPRAFNRKPVSIVDSAAPVATQVVFQRFGFSYSVKRVTLNILDEQVNAFQSFSVLALPVKVIRPSLVSPEFNHRPLPRQVRAWKPFLH